MLRDSLQHVLDEYEKARGEHFVGHPLEETIRNDVVAMLSIYRLVTARGGLSELGAAPAQGTGPDENTPPLAEVRRYAYHRRIERNASLSNAAKHVHGFTCQCCGFDFERAYGPLGHKYIEAHHVVPLCDLDGDTPIPRSPQRDFRVLCANCHRMIHRLIRQQSAPVDVDELRSYLVQ